MKTSNDSVKTKHRGFALIATISVMVLLVMIALAMLSLSTLELRASSSNRAMSEAKANARMALMLALGELQNEVGPDQRITASAAIMDTDEVTEDADGVNQPNYVGVWDSWDTWLTDPKDGLNIQDTYQRGRHPKLFRKWLVSHPDNAWKENRDSAVSGSLTTEQILMVGEGSLGQNGEANDYVRVSKVPTTTGSYAYWVGDESQKASIDLFTATNDLAGDFQLNQLRSSQIHHQGAGRLDGLSDLDVTQEQVAKLVTMQTGENTGVDRDSFRKQFHSLTSGSWSVLSDTRSSGLKRDLSLLFEADALPTDLQTTSLFSGVTFDTPIRPMTGEVGKITPQNPFIAPVSWRQMREYYRLHRSFSNPTHSTESMTWAGDKPFTRRYIVGKKEHPHIMTNPDSAGYLRQPVLLRQTWVLATRTEPGPDVNGQQTYSCYLVSVPVFFLWNPYNLEMKMGSREMAFVAAVDLAANMRYKVYKNNLLVADKDFNIGNENGFSRTSYMARPVGLAGAEISFKPGEVIAFTLDAAVGTREFDANYGYRPLGDTAATRGLQLLLQSLTGVTPGDAPSLALRFHAQAQKDDNFWWGNSSSAMTVSSYQHNLGQFGAYDESGNIMKGSGGHDATVIGTRSIDWMTSAEDNTWIVQDDAGHRAEWDFSTRDPQPFAIISMTAKDTDAFDYDGATGGYAADFRNRTWLHSSPTDIIQYLMNPSDLNRADSAYQVYFKPVNGDQEVSQFIQVNGKNSYYGGGFGPATGQTMAPVYELPTSPPVSLADFATMRMKHARARTSQSQHGGTPSPPSYPMYNLKHAGRAGGSFGLGIGNGYAHPMIAADKIYQRNSFGIDNGHPLQGDGAGTKIAAFDDYWDHLFLTNEALWDSYYLSSMLTDSSRGSSDDNLDTNLDDFFKTGISFKPLSNRLLRPYVSGGTPDPASELKQIDGWKKSAAFVMSRAPFNVNSTSVEAWKALLWSLQGRGISVMDATSGNVSIVEPESDEVLLSRFRLANSSQQGTSAADPAAWQGIRRLKEVEIDRLAEEIVKQVKLRGPFLNMAEFVNRRLSDDKFGVTSALQAAIDWDEFDADYSGTGSTSDDVINRNFKQAGDMISALPVTYPHPLAAKGSRYAGIPGYVMQSDLLQALGNTLTTRGDTFRIRGYGEAKDANGIVTAKAWCEAIVQRCPDYVDPSDDPWEVSKLADGSVNTDVSEVNHRYGRRFNIQSFRWLNKEEI